MMLSRLLFSLVFLAAACKPPASEDYVARVGLQEREAPSDPIDSPDTQGALWAPSATERRILYGIPGEAPLMTLECHSGSGEPRIVFIRNAKADPDAEAVLALIGNGHVSRLWIDATRDGRRWLWRGETAAGDPALEVFTGPNRIEATVPGAGSVILNPSGLPGRLINECRAQAGPAAVPG